MMNAEIIGVGSELLLGQIANTDAQFLSSQMAELGINVYYHSVVGDNSSRLETALKIATSRADLIILTGGLGPTKDDLTKETVASFLDKSLVLDQFAMDQIIAYYQTTNRPMSENNKKQALVIDGSQVLPNDNGMAPGMALDVDGKLFMLLPGPPRELQPMFLQYGRSWLSAKLEVNEFIESRVLRFFGIGESKLESDIEDLIDQQTNPTIAPLAAEGEVTLRLTAKHRSIAEANQLIDQVEHQILDRVGAFFYGYGQTSLSYELFKKLKQRQLTVASAESLTGGLFVENLTQFAGASEVVLGGVVSYTNHVKRQVLQVPAEVLQHDGAISGECAKWMAEHARTMFGADMGISFTGVAGPSESEGKPVGTVFIGIAITGEKTVVYPLQLAGSRDAIRDRSVKYGCYHLLKLLAVQ